MKPMVVKPVQSTDNRMGFVNPHSHNPFMQSTRYLRAGDASSEGPSRGLRDSLEVSCSRTVNVIL